MQTAQATIVGFEESKVRVLFDSGSHKTFISRSVVESLGIQPSRRGMLGIKTFGSQMVETEERDVVKIELKAWKGDENVFLEAFVVDVISEICNEHAISWKNFSLFWTKRVKRQSPLGTLIVISFQNKLNSPEITILSTCLISTSCSASNSLLRNQLGSV